eukprot:TRINITY_DN12915_c0_g1_i1.p2 TRINITY_DN12915_c0_g1~~TRINITY_DN12915_c0_g1_i1.p2  ORF type:complete len:128 (+),score=36.49 TRINITY_DN12915_c0_g1_i1:286-669(+)
MVAFPDFTTSYTVSPSLKTPTAAAAGVAVNNEADDVSGIFHSGNLPPTDPVGVHSMADVGVFASGPGAERVRGLLDNTDLYHIMAAALGVGTGGRGRRRGRSCRARGDGRRWGKRRGRPTSRRRRRR